MFHFESLFVTSRTSLHMLYILIHRFMGLKTFTVFSESAFTRLYSNYIHMMYGTRTFYKVIIIMQSEDCCIFCSSAKS